MEQLYEQITKEGIFTGLTVIGIVFFFTKLVPMAFRAHKEIINEMIRKYEASMDKLMSEHKGTVDKVTEAFMRQIKSNEEWRDTVDSHLRDHGQKLDKLNEAVSNISR